MPLYPPPSTGSGIPASTVTTKGDLILATGSAAVTRQAVGADGAVLVANSAQSTGVNWRALATTDIPSGSFPVGTFTFTAPTSGVGLVVRAAATTPGNIQNWLNTSGSQVTVIDSLGFFYAPGIGDLAQTGSWFSLNPTGTDSGAVLVKTRAPGNIGVAVRATSGQTGSLTEWQNTSGTPMSKVAADGTITAANLIVTGNTNIGNKSLWSGTRTLPGNTNNTVEIGTFASTNGAFQVNLMVTTDISGFAITKSYELDVTASLMTASTWYKVLPQDASQNSNATFDFTLEVNRNATTNQYLFRIRQIGTVAGTLYWQAEGYGSTGLTFTASTATGSSGAAGGIWSPTPLFMGPGRVGVNTDNPATELDVAGVASATTLSVSGLYAGVQNATRLVGATATGTPGSVSELYATGDVLYDRGQGRLWGCVGGGSPGAWAPTGGSIIARATPLTANVSLGAAGAEVTIVTMVAPVIGGRRYRLVALYNSVTSTVLNDEIVMRLYQSTTQLQSTGRIRVLSANLGYGGGPVEATFTASTGGGLLTFTFRAIRASGTGTATVNASATGPLEFYIEDVGTV